MLPRGPTALRSREASSSRGTLANSGFQWRRPLAARKPGIVFASGHFKVALRPKGGGAEVPVADGVFTVGRADSASLRLTGDSVAPEHTKLEKKSGRLMCTALVGDGDMMASTKTWLNANELRSGVEYLVPAGGELAFGSDSDIWIADFEEREADATMAKLMMNAMAQGASEEVKKQLDDRSG